MEQLTKQQIVLVTLLVGFVTSITTGIVTVSLMNQSPKGVSQTITQVVERTIERVASSAGAASTTNQSASAINGVQIRADSIPVEYRLRQERRARLWRAADIRI